jgi:hypothetical protein
LAKYSDDAKYVSAFNRSLKASNQAKLLLVDLNRAIPGTKKHSELKIRYDAAKATANAAEAERAARKQEIDNLEAREKKAKETKKSSESLKAELPQLQYELQVAQNKGDAVEIKKAQDAIKKAKDKAAGIKSTPQGGTAAGETATEGTEEEAPAVSLTDFLKDAIGNPDKIKKLQQALTDARTYKGPINGVFNAETLVPAAEKAEEKLGIYAGLGIVFNDRFEGYARLANGDTGEAGTGRAELEDYVTIASPSTAKNAINLVFQAELQRDATAEELKKLTPNLIAAQKKNPNRVKMVNGVRQTTQGLDVGQWITDRVQKLPEYAQRKKDTTIPSIQILQETARNNGLTLLPNQIESYRLRLQNGEKVETIQSNIRAIAANAMPDNVKKLLEAGSDLNEVYQPYRQSMSTILEIPMDKIDLNDPTLTNAITDKGNMTLFDFKKSLRKDPRWQYTDNAREIVSSGLTQVLKDFGFMG